MGAGQYIGPKSSHVTQKDLIYLLVSHVTSFSSSGHDCEDDFDECDTFSVICSYGGTCVNSYGGFSCVCPSGFSGRTCDENIDDCVGVDCGNGRCFDLVNDYTCICNDGWSGKL